MSQDFFDLELAEKWLTPAELAEVDQLLALREEVDAAMTTMNIMGGSVPRADMLAYRGLFAIFRLVDLQATAAERKAAASGG